MQPEVKPIAPDENSLKGRDFQIEDAPVGIRRSPEEQRAAWLAEQTERWKVLASCEKCGEALVREDYPGHYLNHVRPALRSLARSIACLSAEDRAEILAIGASIPVAPDA